MKTISQVRQWLEMAKGDGWFNKYTIALSVFLVWMLFFDKHNMVVQFQLHHRASNLREQIEIDEQRLAESRRELDIIQNQGTRYAREKHMMHKPDEEVFIISHE